MLQAEEIITHAARTASVCRILAGWAGFDSRQLEETMVSGLLHDIGHLILMENLPGLYSAMPADLLQDPERLCRWERAHLGTTHCDVGAYLLASWGGLLKPQKATMAGTGRPRTR